MDLTIFEAEPAEIGFIRTEWVHSYCRSLTRAPWQALLPDKDTAKSGESFIAHELLKRSQVRVLREGSSMVSFAVVDLDEPLIHYGWTREASRMKGCFKHLIRDFLKPGWLYTRETRLGREVGRRLVGRYDPYLLFRLIGGVPPQSEAQVGGVL